MKDRPSFKATFSWIDFSLVLWQVPLYHWLQICAPVWTLTSLKEKQQQQKQNKKTNGCLNLRHCSFLMERLSKIILQDTLEAWWRHGGRRKCWMDDIREWISLPMPELFTQTSSRKAWKRISAESSLMSPWQPNRSRDWTEQFSFWWILGVKNDPPSNIMWQLLSLAERYDSWSNSHFCGWK